MPVPDYQSLMLPVLKEASEGEHRLSGIVQSLSTKLGLTDTELEELHQAKRYPSGNSIGSGTIRNFFGSIGLDALRINRDTPTIATEIIQHLPRHKGTTFMVTLKIEAEVPPNGVPDDVMRTVTENCITPTFGTKSFDEE